MANGAKASSLGLTRMAAVVAVIAGLHAGCGRGSSQAPAGGASLSPSAAPGASSSRACANGSLADVRRIVGELLRRDDVNPALTMAELHADDLDFIEIVMAIEEHCALEIPDSDIEAGLKMTVEQLARLVDLKVQAKGAGR